MHVLIAIYRALYSAFGPQKWWPGDSPFEIAVGAILTQNTNWRNVEKAINNLKRQKVLAPKKLHELPIERLSELIRPAGYFNIKAKRLKSFISFLLNDYHASMKAMAKEDADTLRKKLLGINGIGHETADSILLYALGKPIFVIDAYTKRVLGRHKLIRHDEPYERFQEFFHSSIKRNVRLYNEYHALLVRVGKLFCKTKAPLCKHCPLKIIL
ncbi:MAG: endonuclease III domain-containing protein [Nitrospirae bacterium]|nr:endonuclease III domain-containing protein [Nitrospirota bacterium]